MNRFLLQLLLNWLAVSLFFPSLTVAHSGGRHPSVYERYLIDGKPINGHFLMSRNDSVFIEKADGTIVSCPLTALSLVNTNQLREKIATLKYLNRPIESDSRGVLLQPRAIFLLLAFAWCYLLLLMLLRESRVSWTSRIVFCAFFLMVIYACKSSDSIGTSSTTSGISKSDPADIERVFTPFKELVRTRFDDNYFYVESTGLPAHNMMVGITSWQQQVPIPQAYTGSNAWSIPLKPELAPAPISLKSNFMKGAVAIAPNGIPIFNPLNNRGEDAFAIGELDQWGGHCGRADDYHYHIAPLHFEKTAGNNPIAMALDGFAIYGSKEPDGSLMQPLDDYHGHAYKNTYHYHATSTYPYFMASMRGKVTIDPSTTAPENQVIPQARAAAIRPAGDPLKGASITRFTASSANAYSLEYTLNNQKGYVNYSWDDKGAYTFTFISPDGKTSTVNYVKK